MLFEPAPVPLRDAFDSGARHEVRTGSGRVTAVSVDGRTVLSELHATSPLRLLRPRLSEVKGVAVCVLSFGGGLVDGDALALDVSVGPDATLVLFTQSTTKVFRGAASQRITAKVAGTLVLLPDPVAAFADARFTQRVDVALTGSGSCVALDGFTSGRAAFGDRWAMAGLDLRTSITRDAERVVTDALRLDAADGSIASRMGRFEAFATLIAVGPRSVPIRDAIESVPIPIPSRDRILVASRLPRADDGAILRVAGTSPSAVLGTIRERLRNLPEMDAVDPFASRY